jgi:hypothetical protein
VLERKNLLGLAFQAGRLWTYIELFQSFLICFCIFISFIVNVENYPEIRIRGEYPHSAIGGSTANHYHFIGILLILSILLFRFLLSHFVD